jgi:hypothetical protein
MSQEFRLNQVSGIEFHTHNQAETCICCGKDKLDIECQECSQAACEGWYGNCCHCGNEYLVSMID